MPVFTEEESRLIQGSSDFFGLNFYTANLAYPTPENEIDPGSMSWASDSDVTDFKDPHWYGGASKWLKVAPFGLRKAVNWMYQNYGKPIYVTENGFSDFIGNIDDMQRVYYYKHYINQLLKAVKIDGVDVRGYYAWSLMDNFEWARGYTERFGLHYVDYDDPERPRTPKESSKFLKKLSMNNGFIE